MKTTLVILLALVLLGEGLLWHRCRRLEVGVTALSTPKDYPLGESMGYMQRYAEKLWFSEQAANWDLADYYQHEMSETAEDIATAHVTKDGVDITTNLNALLPKALAGVEESIKSRDPKLFQERYQALVGACNACHANAKHAFIQITVPSGQPVTPNQRFTP